MTINTIQFKKTIKTQYIKLLTYKLYLAQLNGKMPTFTTISAVFKGDCNTITTAGFHGQLIGEDAINGPGFYAYMLVFVYVRTNLTQVAIGYNVNKIALRRVYDGIWNDWRVI